MGDGILPEYEPIRCWLITQSGYPAGTIWARDEADALEAAVDLYGWATAVVPSCQEPNDWLDAFDREARATHAENEAIIAYAASQVVDRTMTVIEKLFPHLYRERQ